MADDTRCEVCEPDGTGSDAAFAHSADFGTPDPDDVGGRRDAERAAWRAGYDEGRDSAIERAEMERDQAVAKLKRVEEEEIRLLDEMRAERDAAFESGRIEASKQGFSDAWDGGWKAAVKFLWKQGWLRVEELANDPEEEETEAEREVWAKCVPADGVDSPHIGGEPEAGKQVWEQLMEVDASVAAVAERARVKAEPEREHGVGGVGEYEDLPQWAQQALAEHGITKTPEPTKKTETEETEEEGEGEADYWMRRARYAEYRLKEETLVTAKLEHLLKERSRRRPRR